MYTDWEPGFQNGDLGGLEQERVVFFKRAVLAMGE